MLADSIINSPDSTIPGSSSLLRYRIRSIDLYRGIIMIIMALDHVRDYFHLEAFQFDPQDLSKTNGLLFFTRWITNLCAPTFVLLAGTSAFISGQKKSKPELSNFLLKRGLWLIFLELSFVNLGWTFNPSLPTLPLGPIWALGISMVFLSFLIYLPMNWMMIISLILVFGHNLLDGIQVPGSGLNAILWSIIHVPGNFTIGKETFSLGYPAIPWIGLMPLGYALGTIYTKAYDPKKRKKILIYLGLGTLTLFLVLKGINLYGDPLPWSIQTQWNFTLMSFFKVTKYPPSLLYLLITLSPGFFFLAYSENIKGKLVNFLSVYGRVPMFYYILHIYLIHLLAMLASGIFTPVGFSSWILPQPLFMGVQLPGYGFSLGVVYLVWIFVVLSLYPLCIRFDAYKQSHKNLWWLGYI